MKTQRASVWFNAMGRRDRAAGLGARERERQAWPFWARHAYILGWMDQEARKTPRRRVAAVWRTGEAGA